MAAQLVSAFVLLAGLSAPHAKAPPPLPARSPADAPGGPPVVSAKAWAVADGATGAVLWGDNQTAARPIASTTKIMTAWVVLRAAADDAAALDQVVTFSDRAAKTPGSSAKVRAGERVAVKELLYGLLLPSGNDAAVALAEHFGPRLGATGDPVSRFVGEMNRRAKALGLTETSYADPNGLSPENKSSARDLARLTCEAMADARFRERAATRRRECRVAAADGSERTVVWTNTNTLLDIEGYDGVKTGTTTPAGNCLVARGRRGDDTLIVVVLGATSSAGRAVDARNLFRWAWGERERAAPPTPPKGPEPPKESR
jgi:D-alanyl-D-alanine carboxypeptidase (penicillin-binding protein 5/6)